MTLSQETARKLRLMKMGEIVDIVESQDAIAENWNMNFHERMDNLVDQLYQIKNNKRIDTLCRQARFKWPKADVQSMLFTLAQPDVASPTPHVQSESQPAAIATGCAMSASRT